MQFNARIAAMATATILAAGPGLAQTESTETAAPPAPAEDGVGTPYADGQFGDWEKRCVRTEDGNDPCQLYQLIRDETGNPVADATVIKLPEGRNAEAAIEIVTPLETLLPPQLGFRIDEGPITKIPFAFCIPKGCVSQIALSGDDLARFRAGNSVELRIVPARAPNQEVLLKLSLIGFTAGLASLGG